jgi:hypothetical protein
MLAMQQLDQHPSSKERNISTSAKTWEPKALGLTMVHRFTVALTCKYLTMNILLGVTAVL